MASKIDIFNRALSRLGSRRISDPSENSPGAKACASAWDLVRDEVLRSHPWNIAVRRASLAADPVAPEYEYAYAYELPALCLRVLEVDIDGAPWVVEGRQILTDASPPLDIRYVSKVEDTEQYDAQLVSVLAARLAVEIASEVISSSASQQQTLMMVYLRLLGQARMTDAMESSPMEFAEDEWVTIRF